MIRFCMEEKTMCPQEFRPSEAFRKAARERFTREADALYEAIQQTKISNPSTDCISPIGEELILKGICSIAREVRKQLAEEALTCTFSTRRCIQWAKAMTKFHPLRAARMTILNKLNQDDAQVVEGVIQRHFGNG